MTVKEKEKSDYGVMLWNGGWGLALLKMAWDQSKSNVTIDASDTIAQIKANEKLGVCGEIRGAGNKFVTPQGKTELKEQQFFTNAQLVSEQQNIVDLRSQEKDINTDMAVMGVVGAICIASAAYTGFKNSAALATIKHTGNQWRREWLEHTAQFNRDVS